MELLKKFLNILEEKKISTSIFNSPSQAERIKFYIRTMRLPLVIMNVAEENVLIHGYWAICNIGTKQSFVVTSGTTNEYIIISALAHEAGHLFLNHGAINSSKIEIFFQETEAWNAGAKLLQPLFVNDDFRAQYLSFSTECLSTYSFDLKAHEQFLKFSSEIIGQTLYSKQE